MGSVRLSLAALALVAAAAVAKHEIYQGYEVYKVDFDAEEQLRQFHEYEVAHELDVWTHPVLGDRGADVMVTPEQKSDFLSFLGRLGVDYQLHIADVMIFFQERDAEMDAWRSQRSGRLHPFDNYPSHDEVNDYLVRIADQYPARVELVNAGKSFEDRDIYYLKISSSNFEDTSKPIIFLDAMIHAREWVTTPTALYAIHKLVENLGSDEQDMLTNIDWIILPVVNPDGYEHTQNTRLWRRTRSTHDVNDCLGVDANRNFDVEFNTVGVSTNPCSDTWPGVAAFSDPETRIVRDILHENLDRMQTYVNIHSHGNWVLYGSGNGNLPPNAIDLHHVGAAFGSAMDSMKLPQAPMYRVGNSAILLYPTSGSAQDYAQSIGVPFSYTLELPGYGNGFQVPPQHINHINAETWEGFKAMARLSELYYRVRVASR